MGIPDIHEPSEMIWRMSLAGFSGDDDMMILININCRKRIYRCQPYYQVLVVNDKETPDCLY